MKVVSPGWLMAGTALSILGSSLSIPFQMQADRARKTATAIGLLKQEIATLPPDVLADAIAEAKLPPAGEDATSVTEHTRLAEALIAQNGGEVREDDGFGLERPDVPWQNSAAVRKWATHQALADMSMSLPSVSSTAGFSIAPLISSLWGFAFIGPGVRKPLQSVIFGLSPGAENLSTAAAAMGVSALAHSDMDKAAQAAIAMAAKGTERPDLDAAAHDRQARATLYGVTETATRWLSAFGNINYFKQPSLL